MKKKTNKTMNDKLNTGPDVETFEITKTNHKAKKKERSWPKEIKYRRGFLDLFKRTKSK